MQNCWYCHQEFEEEALAEVLVRRGMSKRFFPQFEYEKVHLCQYCQKIYQKKEKRDRLLASIGLVMIFAILLWSFYMLFIGLYNYY